MQFTEDQLNAIDIQQLGRDACIVAGPGSGKTAVLVERYRQLVKSGIAPQKILAITFTEKAAANMKSRLAREFGAGSDLHRQMEAAWVSTVHGFCHRLLRENAIFAGIDPDFEILDGRDTALLQARCLAEALDQLYAEQPEAMRGLMTHAADAELRLTNVYDAIRSSGVPVPQAFSAQTGACATSVVSLEDIDRAVKQFAAASPSFSISVNHREQLAGILDWNERMQAFRGRKPDFDLLAVAYAFKCSLNFSNKTGAKDIAKKLKEELVPGFRDPLLTDLTRPYRETLCAALMRFHALYTAAKRERAVLDYPDLEHFAVQVLEQRAEVRARLREQFRQVMMDEFQDTNGQQSRLIELLRGPDTFYAVGDINQAIFGFRHATPEIFREYRDRVLQAGKHHIELIENWRSRAPILRAVETVLRGAEGVEERQLKAARGLPPKDIPSVELIAIDGSEIRDPLEVEAAWVARRILELRGNLMIGDPGKQRLADFKDMALLVRNSDVLNTFSEVFERAGVEHVYNRRRGFFESRESRDLTHLLRAIANPRDEISTAAVLRSPLVGLSDEALLRLRMTDDNLAVALEKLSDADLSRFDPTDWKKLQNFRENLSRWRAEQAYTGFDRLIARALDASGYGWDPRDRRGANIEKFLELARGASAGLSLAEFVDQLMLMRTTDTKEMDPPLDDELNAVRMMTVHGAKGLEFPIVFLPALHHGVNTDTAAFTFTASGGVGTSWRVPGIPEPQPDQYQVVNAERIRKKDQEESNRLLYVGMTRAEEHLVMSYSAVRNWAKLVAGAFDMAGAPADGIWRNREIGTLGEDPFTVRVVCAAAPPEALPAEFRAAALTQTAQIVDRPIVSGQHDATVTVTSLALFAECPRKYYLSKYLGWQDGRRPKFADPEEIDELLDETTLDASELGLQVHALLAGQTIEKPDWEALRMAAIFDKSELGRRAARATHVERELPFLWAVDDTVIRGQIDLWFEERGKLTVVDYKTDDVDAREAAERAQGYALQLRLYALALQKLTGALPAEAYVYFLRPNVAIAIALDSASLDAAKQMARELAAAQSGVRFPLREGAHCQRCAYFRGLCPATFAPSS